MVLNIHSDQLENYNILSSSVYQAWWYHLGLLPCEDQWGGGEHTVWANPWRLFGENFSNEAHNLQWHLAFQPVSLSLTAKLPSFIVPTLRNSIKKLLKTLLRTVCQFQEGAGFWVVVFFFCLATWFRAMESLQTLSPWIDCIGAEADWWGRHKGRVLYAECYAWCFLTYYLCLTTLQGRADGIPTKKLELREVLRVI